MEVSFYVLPTDQESTRLGLIVKLVEKAYEAKEPTYIVLDDPHFMQALDRAIWGISESAFIPHQVIQNADDITDYDFIYLADQIWPLDDYSLLINLGSDVPPEVTQFKRVFEVITTNPASIEQSRDRYRYYRSLGCEIATHKL